MSARRSKQTQIEAIPGWRRVLFHFGQLAAAIGGVLFISVFFSCSEEPEARPEPTVAEEREPTSLEGQMRRKLGDISSGWQAREGMERAQENFEEQRRATLAQMDRLEREGESAARRAVAGLILVVIGGACMAIASRGPASAGLVLSPRRQRREQRPWARMKGQVLDDTLNEVSAIDRIAGPRIPAARQGPEATKRPEPAVKVRCQSCRALNDEVARFCQQCGEKI